MEPPTFNELDTVVLDRDLAEHGLRRGDVGVIVALLSAHSFEVEFVTSTGRTQAIVTLSDAELRGVGEDDLLAVRSRRKSAG